MQERAKLRRSPIGQRKEAILPQPSRAAAAGEAAPPSNCAPRTLSRTTNTSEASEGPWGSSSPSAHAKKMLQEWPQSSRGPLGAGVASRAGQASRRAAASRTLSLGHDFHSTVGLNPGTTVLKHQHRPATLPAPRDTWGCPSWVKPGPPPPPGSLHPPPAPQKPLEVLLLLPAQVTTTLGLGSSSHVWQHGAERGTNERRCSPWAAVLPAWLGAGRDLMGAFLPRDVPSAVLVLPRTCSPALLCHQPHPPWVLLGMGAAGDGYYFQGWVLLGIGASRDRGSQSQPQGLVLLLHPHLCCGRHSGTGTSTRWRPAQETSCANTSLYQEQVPLRWYYPCGFPVAAKDIPALLGENGGQWRDCCTARCRQQGAGAAGAWQLRSRVACTPPVRGSSIVACTLIRGCAGMWDVSSAPSLARDCHQLHACTAPSATGPPLARYLPPCYLLANNKRSGWIPSCQLVQEGSPSSQQHN